ncbi:hypothetical protein [Zwartia sp.]|uniref:hypothetical protein n=1 Tax=Zwartia sp. TaxID=2978004 RepID=UPI003BAEC91D
MQTHPHQEHSHPHGQQHAHDHAHVHAHDHAHTHTHGSASLHAHAQTKDLKSPVLIGLGQRLLWITSLLVVLWLVVFWALHTHG